jgi:hypothetical protein
MARRVRRARKSCYRCRPEVEALEPRLLLAADFGDAPSPYPTLLASNGARHEAVGPLLGAARDSEVDGQISAGAVGDDNLAVDDEEGVTWGTIRVGQADATVTVVVNNAPSGAKLDAWIDFNGDGSWDITADQIAANVSVVEGSNSISFNVPANIPASPKYARFRLSAAGGLSPRGAAADGEVEDYQLTIASPRSSKAHFGPAEGLAKVGGEGLDVVDVDQDGDLDLVSGSFSDGTIAWEENDGQQNFTVHVLEKDLNTSGNGVLSIASADLDGDGDIDFISAASERYSIAWHENDGQQNFTTHAIVPANGRGRFVETGDVDGDGDADIVAIANQRLSWFENSNGSFTEHVVAIADSGSPSVDLADIDADGDLDLVTSLTTSALTWQENHAGMFTSHTIANLPGYNARVRAADIDNDGRIDVLTSNSNGPIQWFKNGPGTTFTTKFLGNTQNHQVWAIDTGDINGDGMLDIIVGPSLWLRNLGNSKFTAVPNLQGAQMNYNVIAVDLDQDGDVDILSDYTSYPASIRWFENVDNGIFMLGPYPYLNAESSGATLNFGAQRFGDGSAPLTVVMSLSGTATLGVDYTISGATLLGGGLLSITIPAEQSLIYFQITPLDDFQFEADETIIATLVKQSEYIGEYSPVDWASATIVDDEPGDFGDAPAPYPTLETENGPRHGATGPRLGSTRDAELNGQPSANANGDDEAADPTGGIVFGTIRAGQQNTVVTVDVQNAPAGARLDVWIDFDRDGHWDGIAENIFTNALVHEGLNQLTFDVPSNAQPGQTFARFRLSTAGGLGITGEALDGEVEDATVELQPPVASSGKFAFGGTFGPGNMLRAEAVDLDNDNDLDLVWNSFDAFFRGVYWSENTGAGFTRPPNLVDAGGLHFSIGDITNDGIPDIATAGDGRRTFVFQNDGLGHFTGAAVLPFDAPYEVFDALQLVDLDQDGDLDFVGDSQSGGLAWIENLGSGQFATRAFGHGGPAVGTPADFDRDGDLDFVAPGASVWMENTGDFVYAKRFLPTPNSDSFKARLVVDLDHDGNLDIVGTDTYGRLAWLRNNGNRTFTPHSTDYYVDLQLTVNGSSALTVGDVNGDGFIDIVGVQTPQYREDRGGVWYKNDGAGNFTRQVFFTDAHPYALQAARLADLDNDGDLDFFGTTSWNGATWYRNVSTGVTIAVDSLQVSESGGQGLTYTFHRTDSASETLSVNFDVSGSASFGADYTATGAASFSEAAGTIVFPAGVDTVQITIVPSDDNALESRETVILTLAAGDDYVPEGNVAASGTITDDEPGDFGDAPGPYATTHTANGAGHFASGPTLGSLRDEEPNGQPTNGASGDDAAGVSDEDGVHFGTVRVGALGAVAIVNVESAPTGAYLDAWIDFNGDGNWDGPLEAIATRHLVHNGDNAIMFDVPSTAVSGTTYARFRLSSGGGLGPYGIATDGEVEDHAVVIDAPKATPATFSARRPVGANAYADVVSTGDFDGDGDTDLVAISESYARLTWYENDGRGQFAAHIVATGTDGHVVLIVDLDQDQDLDIVAGGDYGLHAYLNDGTAHFVDLPIRTDTIVDVNEVVAADFNGDGRMDLLVGDELGASNTITWLENKGPAGFVEHFVTDKTGTVRAIDVADFDGDGDIDFVTPGSSSDEGVRWYENDGFANFTQHTLPALSYPGLVRAADINGDGRTDILVGGNGLWIYFNDGAGAFHSVAVTNGITNAVTCADLDGDGDLDLVTSFASGPRQLRRYLNDGSGAFVLQIVESSYQVGYRTNVADIDGDGALDLLSTSGLAWFRNLGPLVGDFNQDLVVNSGDYVLWRKTQGLSVPKYSGADADGDGIVGAADYKAWRLHFGESMATTGVSSSMAAATEESPTPDNASADGAAEAVSGGGAAIVESAADDPGVDILRLPLQSIASIESGRLTTSHTLPRDRQVGPSKIPHVALLAAIARLPSRSRQFEVFADSEPQCESGAASEHPLELAFAEFGSTELKERLDASR